MAMQLNVAHVSLKEREESEGTKIKGEEEDQDVMPKMLVIKFVNRLEGRNRWRVARVGRISQRG
jgi:hypothetical protein